MDWFTRFRLEQDAHDKTRLAKEVAEVEAALLKAEKVDLEKLLADKEKEITELKAKLPK